MSKSLFSGLEDLGFDNIDNIDLYKKEEEKQAAKMKVNEEDTQRSLLYDKQVTCPACETTFKARAVKTSSYRILKKDSDFFIRYSVINPYFYDVWVCDSCGYSAMKSDFNKIKGYEIDMVKEKITSKWRSKNYPEVYDINIAIERYKLSLLNYYMIEAKASKKAMNCLKLSWMYRLLENHENEIIFLKQALEGFNEAYFSEGFPIYGMDKFTSMYLIGELNRRLDKEDDALSWFSQLITTQGVPQRLKDLARDQRDLMKENSKKNEPKDTTKEDTEDFSIEEDKNKKTGFFSRFFK